MLARLRADRSAARRASGHRPHPRHAGRQDRAEPADERDAGGDGAGALQVVVCGLRPRARQGRRPRPRPAQRLADLFPDSFEDSELGEIPGGWKVASIYEIADVIYGAPFASATFNTEGLGLPLIRIRDLANESPAVWTTEAHPKGYVVRPGEIVVGMDGEFRAYLWGGAEGWLNQRVCVFVPKGAASAAFGAGQRS